MILSYSYFATVFSYNRKYDLQISSRQIPIDHRCAWLHLHNSFWNRACLLKAFL